MFGTILGRFGEVSREKMKGIRGKHQENYRESNQENQKSYLIVLNIVFNDRGVI